MSCPFYGFQRSEFLRALIQQCGNGCPLRPRYAPCTMEIAGLAPEVAVCPVARDHSQLAGLIRAKYTVIKRDPPARFPFSKWEARLNEAAS